MKPGVWDTDGRREIYENAELDLDKRNPFTRLIIRNEGDDVSKRGTFTNEQLKIGYDKALRSGSRTSTVKHSFATSRSRRVDASPLSKINVQF